MAKRIVVEFAGETRGLDQAVEKAKKQSSLVDGAFKKLGSQASNFGSQFGAVGDVIGDTLSGSVAAPLLGAGAAIGAFAAKGISDFVHLAEQTRKLAEATGATTQEASGFIAIGDDFNVSAEQLQSSFFKLEKGIGQGKLSLEEYGAEVVRTQSGGVDLTSTVASIADAYNRLADPADKAALLTEAFGKSGDDMIPIIQAGGAAIRDMFAEADKTHQILDPEDVQRGEDFRLAMDNLGDSVKGLAMQAGEALVPALTDVVKTLTQIIALKDTLGKPVSWVGKLLGAVSDQVDKIPVLNHNYGGFAIAMKYAGVEADDASTGLETLTGSLNDQSAETKKVTDFWKDYDKQSKEVAKTLKENEKATEDAVKAQRELPDLRLEIRSSNLALEQSQHALNTAQDEYNKFLQTGGIDMEKVKSAQEDLVRSQKAVEAATQDVAKAQEAVNEALKPATQKERLKNSDDQARAQNDLTIAQLDAKDAQKAYADLVVSGTATQDELTRAWVRADEAARNVTDAEDRLKETQTTANDLAQKGTTNTQAYKDAVQVLKEKQDALKTATDAQTAAQGALVNAQSLGKDHAEQLWEVTENLKNAQLDLDQKTRGAEKAQLALKDAMKQVNSVVWDTWGNVIGLKDELKSGWSAPFSGLASSSIPRANIDGWGNPIHRAGGGPVTAGMSYMVGEVGPELFVPSRSGTIVPNGAGMGTVVNVYFNGVVGDRASAAREIQNLLLEEKRKSGPLGLN